MADSWLFAKPGSAVFVVRSGSMAVDVYGPGPARASRAFATDTDLVSFLRETDANLVASGYRPRGYGADRRGRDERRDRSRADAADRRQSSMNP